LNHAQKKNKPVKIKKTLVMFAGEPMSTQLLVDTVDYEERKWLVPKWLDRADIGMSRPRLAICLDGFLSYTIGGHPQADYLLLEPLSRDVYEGSAQLELGGRQAVIQLPPWDVPSRFLLQ
jgi:hypothetical protein